MNIYSKRTMSALPISVGTSLALESCFPKIGVSIDPIRTIPQEVSLSAYKFHYFNIITLIRNIINALDTKADETRRILKKTNAVADLLDTVVDETNIILETYKR